MVNKIPYIDHLILISAPPGAGKSSFLENPRNYFDSNQITKELDFLNEDYIEHIQIAEDTEFKIKKLNRLVIHIDLFNFSYNPKPIPENFEEIQKNLKGKPKFLNRLKSYFDKSKKITNLILLVNPLVNSQRYFSRYINQNLKVNTIKSASISSQWNGGEIQKYLYKFWNHFLKDKKIDKVFFISICKDKYYFISYEEYIYALETKLIDYIPKQLKLKKTNTSFWLAE